jgi:predicted DNA-binding transcriptional regulator AlpA
MEIAAPRPEQGQMQLEAEPWGRAGISRSHAYALMAETPPAFPKPVKVGRASRFVSTEIDMWIAARIAARDSAAVVQP